MNVNIKYQMSLYPTTLYTISPIYLTVQILKNITLSYQEFNSNNFDIH